MQSLLSSQWTSWDGLYLLLMGRRTLAVFSWVSRASESCALCTLSTAHRLVQKGCNGMLS